MSKLIIHTEKLTPEIKRQLIAVCPFGAIEEKDGALDITAACRMCGMCVRRGPAGVMEMLRDEPAPSLDKAAWRGVTVFAEKSALTGRVHPVAFELLGKARDLAAVTGHPVSALLIGHDLADAAGELLCRGADRVFVYDHPALADFRMDAYAAAFADYVRKEKPSSILVGATNVGRSLAPRVAALFGTGLTADCTRLEMKDNTDLVQIRPAFGGNVMAQIVTPAHRPQFCTVRYKIFDAAPAGEPHGAVVRMTPPPEALRSVYDVIEVRPKPVECDISEAECIVACGRGVKAGEELETARAFADRIGAQLACSRPMVEAGLFDPRRQIGLSGRTVKPKLIITLGVSGAVQFAAGMQNAERIIAVNTDPEAPIFRVAHLGLVGDWKEIIRGPMEELCREK
ncbi:MAG: electron transfer flavoprotein subunit alpha [Clostridia bacterium]|nr:electron transfer flavoprotein subunit alpha [Clostridia bacterium]